MTQKSLNKNLLAFIILLMAPLSGVGIDIYTPSLPVITHYFAVKASLIKLTLSVYLLGLGFGQFIFGILSDSFGRRRLLLSGMIIYILVSASIAISFNISMLLTLRFLQGLITGVPAVIYRSIMMDCFKGSSLKQITGNASIIWALGPIIAPLIGSYLQHYFNWQANFYFLCIYGFILLLLVYFFLPETILEFTPFIFNIHVKNVLQILKHRLFMMIAITISLGSSVPVIFNVVAPYMIQTILGHTAVFYGHIALFTGLAYFIGCLSNNWIIKEYSLKNVILTGLITVNIGGLISVFLAIFYGMHWITILFPMLLIYLAYGWVQPNGFIRAISVFPRASGTVSSLWGSLILITSSFICSLAILLEIHNLIQFSLAIFVLGLIYLIVNLLFIHPYFSEEY
ncbi:multidrug effflux MFS transporter [Coxiella endosymbiont of Amblyomma nuttalli]|uniref:multidrug effflux MFS transporter n=1 Tax=Coxiella endosymbiont of Amblyomma nuttalli TaxID=2749996 RepID=UPI001BA5BE73|nr:multidrug effflux MFS transporter [Coxiella endosymbiont of Amblyomma nuttalli]QTS83866.1 Bicyclomycin resistance protein [Coxiella endosymbiont of Amblyomma nuttalli]